MASSVLSPHVRYCCPTLQAYCKEIVQRIKEYQRFANHSYQSPKILHHIVITWTFNTWGSDILGPIPPTPSQIKFVVVIIDYFS